MGIFSQNCWFSTASISIHFHCVKKELRKHCTKHLFHRTKLILNDMRASQRSFLGELSFFKLLCYYPFSCSGTTFSLSREAVIHLTWLTEVKVQSNSQRGGSHFKAGLREPKWPPAWLQNLPLKCPYTSWKKQNNSHSGSEGSSHTVVWQVTIMRKRNKRKHLMLYRLNILPRLKLKSTAHP